MTTPSASEAVVIDSSGWLEYVTADTKADQFAPYVEGDIALAAATFSIRYSLPMADALLYATAQSRTAQFITSDAHFGNLPGVTLI